MATLPSPSLAVNRKPPSHAFNFARGCDPGGRKYTPGRPPQCPHPMGRCPVCRGCICGAPGGLEAHRERSGNILHRLERAAASKAAA